VLTAAQHAQLRFDDAGRLPAVVQQYDTGEVLMVAWMDEAALHRTLQSGETVFFSRSRGELWHKGETSGNTQRVVDIRVDCDGDVLLILVDQQGDGVACHTGQRSCFHRHLDGSPAGNAPAAPPLAGTGAGDEPPADPGATRRPQR
jgi:phosphoribosyl-AMP cyclohydrolase